MAAEVEAKVREHYGLPADQEKAVSADEAGQGVLDLEIDR